MNNKNQPEEPSNQLDLTSEPPAIAPSTAKKPQKINKVSTSQRVRLFFGCCRVSATLTPPEHVLQGDADVWRAHCPRCGALTEILFQ
jgi:hypothetical protein